MKFFRVLIVGLLLVFLVSSMSVIVAAATSKTISSKKVVNLCLLKGVKAVATSSWDNTMKPEFAIDNKTNTFWCVDVWGQKHSGAQDTKPWLTVNLGSKHQITSIEIEAKNDGTSWEGQRKEFEIWASNTANFKTKVVLASKDSKPFGDEQSGGIWKAATKDKNKYQYIRIAKLKQDELGLAEFRVLGY